MKTKMYAGVLAIFILGAVCGGVGTSFYIKQRIHKFMAAGPEAMREIMVKRLEKKLKLRPEQQAQGGQAVSRAMERLRALRERNRPELELILNDVLNELRPGMDERQREKIDRFAERLKQQREVQTEREQDPNFGL